MTDFLRRLSGLSSNPVFCDCNARALQRWLQDKVRSANDLFVCLLLTYLCLLLKLQVRSASAADDLGDLGEVRCAAPDALAGR